MWVILYLSRERQHFKNTLVYIRRNKAKNYGFFWGGKSFFRNILLIFLIDFWLSFLKFSECNLIFFVWFLDFFSILLFFFIERKKMIFFWWRGSQLNFFCTHAGFFFFLQIIHVESKIQLHLPIILVAVNAFIGVSDVKEKVLFMVFLKKK